jgi:phosphoribosylglycinamide formyltransferase 1
MRAIVRAIEDGRLPARARLVVSNRRSAAALEFAAAHGIATLCIPTIHDEAGADARLCAALDAVGADLILLSGYLRKLGPRTLDRFAGRVLNVHPALLPDFGGRGFYGQRVHAAVAASGVRESGATIHVVDGEYDHGPTIAQKRVALAPGDDAASIERKVTAIEPDFYIETLQAIASGAIRLP